ncbi:hypothetical protein [Fimbriimonas ginsengisoli]|uniref:Uncharacterized protein n=1 Tax=Fimbriimonas ginsengisoli Gsoil 348 TaxID=661478 RepID=A0A068NYN1_FIMGI|nr:hypothetical protein [Fimbriimonas ginsengisoli]AIE87114.1 hypothetical protein OP10G_3746 [Fimbriimonas ginsengisoli Gsoil 348]
MTTAARACLGALLGALLTLVLHPVSRPFLLATFQHVTPSRLERCIDANAVTPPVPQDLKGASLWLELASERIVDRATLSPREVATLIQIAEHAEALEPQNAYWSQQKAVYLDLAGRNDEAKRAWERASRATFWNDYQTDRIIASRKKLAELVGAQQAWQLAYVYHERSDAPSILMERFARTQLGRVGLETPADLRMRYLSLLNGSIMVSGAKSIAIGVHGANVIELVAYPKSLMHDPSPSRLWAGQNAFLNQLAKTHMQAEGIRARAIFRQIEGWRALTQYQEPQELIQELSAGAVVSATFTSAATFAAVVGAVCWLVGWGITRRVGARPKLSPFFVVVAALLLALLGISLTHDLWAGLVGALAGAFLLVGPSHARNNRPEDLGPLFAFLIIVIAAMCGLAVGAYATSRSVAGVALFPSLSVPTDYYNTPLLLGLAAIFFSLLLVAVPLWSLVQRLSTAHVLGLALRKLGAYLAIGATVLGIFLGPVAVYMDRSFSQTLNELVLNEPVYYIVHS